MQNIYFKGLEKALNGGCYIKVFRSVMGNPAVRIERKEPDTNKEELVGYAEHYNVLTALNVASSKIIDELYDESGETLYSKFHCDYKSIDSVIGKGYTLQFFKLSNNQVLSAICAGGYGNYIPVKSIISDDIKTGFLTLNASLQPFEFGQSYDFDDFANSQIKPVDEYKKILAKEKK